VQREELAFRKAHRWAHRHASWALWSSGVGMLLAVIALFSS
jgi:hypothetical protein